jgi:hypothetical protein
MDHINPDGKDLAGQERKIKLLHIYPQYQWHCEAYIVGNTEALTELRDALNRAIESGKAETTGKKDGVFVSDGEGYDVVVIPVNEPWESETWNKLMYPYSDPIASGYVINEKGEETGWGKDRIHPAELPGAPKYTIEEGPGLEG